MAVEIFSLPTELTCHILLFLAPRDICHCAMTCKAFWNVAQNSVDIKYKLELYAQGLIETATLDSTSLSRKMSSLKKLTSLWRSEFRLNTVFDEAVIAAAIDGLPPWLQYSSWTQSVKCGLWWMSTHGGLFVRDCNKIPNLSRTWLKHSPFSSDQPPIRLTVDPLQDLVVLVFSTVFFDVADTEQDHHVFWVEFRLASSQGPHPDSVCVSLECMHTFDAPGSYHVFVTAPSICGDRIFIYYYLKNMENMTVSATFIQMIDWRKGTAKRCLLLGGPDNLQQVYAVNQRTIVDFGLNSLTVYTLQEPDGSLHPRLTYLLPKSRQSDMRFTVVHASPSFCGAAARTDLVPGHVPSPESQILVLEFLSGPQWRPLSVILVIDMVIFSGTALQSETHVQIPWSEWGPQHTCCFPHDRTHQISVFGSKIAYALPQDHTPEPGQRLEELPDEGHFYIHIWDFNTRLITRSEHIYNPDSSDLPIRKPGVVIQSCFDEDIISNHPYTAIACRTPFPTNGFRKMFLEQDRLTLTWSRIGAVDIQVVSPAQTEVE
ncbi:hypothetical protein DFJ58DRAFT_864483 [Suillus subalutaceus]|uniref:uncharacterized protein n=1 Tax=Suillus subalutaceus TaxID=48586 RepID=UPI001B884DF0|nr:uncharacterized protein DFJ58DRAFT_864483 [Suillus subalutaceus]KAG1865453.1 hypothetical protein DFJ58DRAFT_864483 [Suillus subalutaceus]